MKFLICGIGSIGQRHYKNLQSLGHELALFREGGGANTPFIEKFLSEEKSAGREVKAYYNFQTAVDDFKPDAVFITNPNSKHIETALLAAKSGLNMFVEKPLSHNRRGIKELKALAEKKNLKIMIGYNLRWHPLLIKMKMMIEDGVIGQPICANIEMGENIEDWHPWEDYRQAYAAYKDGGGGAVLCFSHDIDYLYWFFGMPDKIHAVGGKITPLGGDAEDMVKALLEYKNNFIVSLHLDYWQRPPRRFFEIIGIKGRITWDYYAKNLTFVSRDNQISSVEHSVPDNFDRNDMFIDEARDFIDALENKKEVAIPLQEGINVLEISRKIKELIGF
ncbi:MAG: Gfo/Idh/MocA family oxidoreductase [Syntrophaceae bacterium]|nr:Gfo/Idh/MocA family oxidoreductase [Syntrophaceae bacterium]